MQNQLELRLTDMFSNSLMYNTLLHSVMYGCCHWMIVLYKPEDSLN